MGKLQSIYLKLPNCIKTRAMTAYGYILKRKRQGLYYQTAYEQEKNNDKLSIHELEQVQLDKLKELLLEAYQYSEYYKKSFKNYGITVQQITDAGSAEELVEKLPVLPKQEFKENIHQLESTDPKRKTCATTYTSGSTGTPMAVHVDKEANQYTFALWRRFYDWMGLPNKFKNVRFSGRIIVEPERRTPPYWVYNGASRQLFMSTYHMTMENMPFYIKELNRFQPELIDGYPSAIATVADYLLGHGQTLKFTPIAIATTAETLTEDAKRRIQEAFRCPVYNQYASSEGAPFACECREGSMHLWTDTGIFEFVDPVPVSDELLQAELMVTSFRSKKTPLIRYRIGDMALIYKEEKRCPCGCRYPIIHSITGRRDDILYTEEKGYVGRLDTAYKGLDHIRESQIVQTALDKIEIYLVTECGYTEKTEQELKKNLQNRLGTQAEYQFLYVDWIPRGANGKFRSVIRKCAIGGQDGKGLSG